MWNAFWLWWHSDSLNSRQPIRRLKAVQKLPLQPAERVSSFLVAMLDDPYEDIRAAVAKKLGQIKVARSAGPLVRLLVRERDPEVHTAVAAALQSHPAECWISLLVSSLDDPDAKIGETASAALRTIGWNYLDATVRARVAVMRCDWALAAEMGPCAVPALKAKLREGTALTRRDAADALCKIGDDSALAAIVDVVRDRRVDSGAREAAAWALRALQWNDVDPADAARAAIALGSWADVIEIGCAAILPLTWALRNPDAKVRLHAAQALGAIGGREAADALGAALVDQSLGAQIRTAVAQELARVGGEHVIAFLTAALADKEWSVRVAAAQSLAEMAWKPSRPWDRALYAIAMKRVEDAIAVGPAAIPALTDALRFPSVCGEAGAALARMGKEGADALAAISKNPKAELPLREAASTALASIGDARAVEPLHSMLKDADLAVRHSAVWALERLGWHPECQTDRAVVALVHEDWNALEKIGVAAIEPLIRQINGEGDSPMAMETLRKVFDTGLRRIPVEQLRHIIQLAGPATKGGSSTATAVASSPIASLAKPARMELIRRGMLK